MNNKIQSSEHIAETINRCHYNLKAETIVALIKEPNQIKTQINYTSCFNRSYRKDLYNTRYDKDKDVLDISISRNGFYDMLPEGLFHEDTVNNERNISISNLISSHKKQKKEEADARLFFNPFENHLFQFLVQIEKKEKSLLNNSHEFQNFFKDFWDMPLWIQDEEFFYLLRILPHNKQIKGNLNKTVQLLSHHLKKEITYNKTWIEFELPSLPKPHIIKLGHNFIMGNSSDQLPFFEFIIHDISDEELLKFSKGGYYYNFIKLFFDYLLPIELEYTIKPEPNYNQIKNNFGVLGHSTTLQISKN